MDKSARDGLHRPKLTLRAPIEISKLLESPGFEEIRLPIMFLCAGIPGRRDANRAAFERQFERGWHLHPAGARPPRAGGRPRRGMPHPDSTFADAHAFALLRPPERRPALLQVA
jgi:hypothetical protein